MYIVGYNTVFSMMGRLRVIVTVRRFRVQRLWVHRKPACHPSGRSEPFIRELEGRTHENRTI